jgi:hypothetical protein
MKCPVCENGQVEMMWGCTITKPDKPGEKVERLWCCVKCDSGGSVAYVQDLKSIKINVKHGVKKKKKS